MLDIYIDADACPVKDETYRVAERYELKVFLVSNSWMHAPQARWLEQVVVKGDLDAADIWIAEHAAAGDIVITADVPLAARCVSEGAQVLSPRGRRFTEDSVGDALASRDLLTDLRGAGEITGGPPPMQQRDRSQFLQRLDQIIHEIRRSAPTS